MQAPKDQPGDSPPPAAPVEPAPPMPAPAMSPAEQSGWESLLTASARLETAASMLAAQLDAARARPEPRPPPALAQVAASLDQTAARLTSLGMAPPPPAMSAAGYAVETPYWPEPGRQDDYGCGPRDPCCGPNCCCWEVRLIAARMLAGTPIPKPEEPVDGEIGILPIGGFEVVFFISADKVGVVHPSLTYPMSLSKQAGGVGAWVSCGSRLVNRVCFCKGTSKRVELEVEAWESDEGVVERVLGGKDEFGTASATMVLDCCGTQVGPLDIDLYFTMGGTGEGAIQVRVMAYKVA